MAGQIVPFSRSRQTEEGWYSFCVFDDEAQIETFTKRLIDWFASNGDGDLMFMPHSVSVLVFFSLSSDIDATLAVLFFGDRLRKTRTPFFPFDIAPHPLCGPVLSC